MDRRILIVEGIRELADVVAYLLHRLKVLRPAMAKAKIAEIPCRAGLHLGSTTVSRMLREAPRQPPAEPSSAGMEASP